MNGNEVQEAPDVVMKELKAERDGWEMTAEMFAEERDHLRAVLKRLASMEGMQGAPLSDHAEWGEILRSENIDPESLGGES